MEPPLVAKRPLKEFEHVTKWLAGREDFILGNLWSWSKWHGSETFRAVVVVIFDVTMYQIVFFVLFCFLDHTLCPTGSIV